jgi:predicted secreted protein
MSQTTGIFNGTNLKVYVAGNVVARATSCELSISSNLRDATTKDSGGDAERLPGLREWSLSTDALYSEDYSGAGVDEIFAAIKNGTKLAVKFSSNNVGDHEYAGDAYVTDMSLNAGTEENATYSASFQGTGAISNTIKAS